MFFGFLSFALIARFFSRAEYGVFRLALTILSVALVIATLGFQNFLPGKKSLKSVIQKGRYR